MQNALEFADAGSNLGKWDAWYGGLKREEGAILYGDPTSYLLGASFLADVADVEDWGCGKGGFRNFFLGESYRGIDGSHTPFADEIVDLRIYRSNVDAVFLRHVLEHDYGWRDILANAVQSFRRKLVLVLFTPLSPAGQVEIAHNRHLGVDVPDLSLCDTEVEEFFGGCRSKKISALPTRTQYKEETIYFVWRE